MLNYKSSVLSSKKYTEDDIATAYKTNYQPGSPSRIDLLTPKSKSISRYQNRVADARNNINDLISEMEHKKTMNADAASRVKYSNQDLLAFINEYSGSPSARPMTPTNMKYSPPNAPHHNRTNMLNHQMHNEEAQYTIPHNHDQMQRNIMPQRSSFISHINNIPQSPHMNNFSHRNNMSNINNLTNMQNLQNLSLEDQNLQLRRALNEQIKENNMLMKRIKYLERQNQDLKGVLSQYTGKNYASNYQQYPRNMNPEEEHTYDEMEAPETAKFHSHQLRPNYSVNNMNDQNNMGRNNNANMGGNVRNMNNNYQTQMGSMPSMPRNVNQMGPQGSGDRERILAMYRELQSLKDNDESLRQKTINVLKNC